MLRTHLWVHVRRTLPLLGPCALAACTEDPLPTAPRGLPRLTTQFAVAAADSQARTGRAPEAAATHIALAVPGFGGFVFDTANGDLVVWVKDPARQQSAAVAAVRNYLASSNNPGGRAGRTPRVRIRPADYDFLELGSLRDRANSALEGQGGVRFTDLDEANNRVAIGVAPESGDQVRRKLLDAGLPPQALRFEFLSFNPNDTTEFFPADTAPTVQDEAQGSGAPTYLSSKFASPAGGAMFGYLIDDHAYPLPYGAGYKRNLTYCSVGAIGVTTTGAVRILTAGHCSDTLGVMRGTDWYQPTISGFRVGQPINDFPWGEEVLDPAWRGMGLSCISCKLADALLGSIFPPRGGQVGKIHRPVSSTSAWTSPVLFPAIQIDAAKPTFTIVSAGDNYSIGNIVHKVGYRSGWTFGPITDTCRDSYVSGPLRRIKCQLYTALPAYGGDSGGSVFRFVNPYNDSEVEFIGVVSRGNEANQTIVSPWSQIVAELGQFSVTSP
jgi:hypothetical protein